MGALEPPREGLTSAASSHLTDETLGLGAESVGLACVRIGPLRVSGTKLFLMRMQGEAPALSACSAAA